MSQLEQLADRYIAIWNETNPERRRALIAQTYTEDATYLDPMLEGQGHAGIDAMIQSAQAKYPRHRFQRTTTVDVHHDRLRFSWVMNPESGPPLAKGTDVCVVMNERLRSVLGFFDEVQGKATVNAIPAEVLAIQGGSR